MGVMIFQHASDNLAVTVTPVVNTGSEDPTYPATFLIDGNPARPAKLTTTTGSWVWDFGSATQIDIVAIIHHNLTAGLDVKIQGNATNSWGAPTLSQAITIPAYRTDGFPVNPFVDLTGIVSRSFRFWRLLINAANGAAVAIGEVWLGGTKRTLTYDADWGLHETEEHPIVQHTTDYQVDTIYNLAVVRRTMSGQVQTTDVGFAQFKDWWRACDGRAKAFLWIPEPTVNDCWLARFKEQKLDWERHFLDWSIIPLELEEVSRGLKL